MIRLFRHIRKGLLRCSLCILATCFVAFESSPILSAVGQGTAAAGWANPAAVTIKRLGSSLGTQSSPNFFENTDCTELTYRLTGSSDTLSGCFVPTAFGMVDSDTDRGIFNGSDEAAPLQPYSAGEVLAPWPNALDLLAFDSVNTGGSYVSLYKDPYSVIHDQRDIIGRITAKQLVAPPELPLKDGAGSRLIVNAQSVAFSTMGSWMVVETTTGSFDRINLSNLRPMSFAPAFGSSGSPALLKSQTAINDDGRYVAIHNQAADSFKVYDLSGCADDGGTAKQICSSHDYEPYIASQIPGLQRINHVRFVNDALISFDAVSSETGLSGSYELAPESSIQALISYLATGDSYTSGEGAFDYISGTDTGDNVCHLSSKSYPLLLAADVFGSSGHSVACSGALINDVGSSSDSYIGQNRGAMSYGALVRSDPTLLEQIEASFTPGNLAQQRFVRKYQPGVLTVSVGGDDAGFGDIVERCVEPQISRHTSDSTCFSTYEDRLELVQLIDKTKSRLTTLYKQLHAASPSSALYVIGYPQIAVDTGSCALNVHLDKSEIGFAEEITAYLNDAIAAAAQTADVQYVDISQALAGHRLCETASYNVAVNGLTAGKDAGPFGVNVFGKESYHPNALGQELIEQAILRATNHFATASIQPTTPGTSNILNAPKSGRQVYDIRPDDTIVSGTIYKSGTVQISVDGIRQSLEPHTSYSVHVDGPTGPVLGTIMSDSDGNVTGGVPIGDADSGGHTIDITGPGDNGPIDVVMPVQISDSPTDADRDGIPDASDSCPTIPNSGVDADGDGVDDACDAVIGASPTSGGNGAPPPASSNPQPVVTTTIPPSGPGGDSASVQPSVQVSAIDDSSEFSGLTIAETAKLDLPSTAVGTVEKAPKLHVRQSRSAPPFSTAATGAKHETTTKIRSALLSEISRVPAIDWRSWVFLFIVIQLVLITIVALSFGIDILQRYGLGRSSSYT